MSTEEKILDYMDGTLSENESGELLHSLSVSPEKRVVLEQHIKLRELTGLAQKPLAVPQALEASMAERFSAIADYNRELAGGAMIVEQFARPSLIGRMAASVAAFMAQYPVRTGFALAAASVIGYFAFAGGDRTNVANEVATTSNQRPSMVDGRSSIVGGGNANNNIQSSTSDKVPSAITKPSDIAPKGSNFSHQSNESHNSHSNSSSSPKANIPSQRDRIASNQATPTTKHVKEAKNQNVANKEHNTPEKLAVTPPEKTPVAKDQNVADAPNAVANNNNDGKNEKVVETPNSNNPAPAKDIASSNPAKENSVKDNHSTNVSLAENNVHGSSTEQNPFKEKNDISGFPLAFRVYGSVGGSLVNVHNNDAILASRFEGAALIGVDYIVNASWSFGIEGGNAAISQLITQSALQTGTTGLPSISRVVVNNVVTNGSQFYARAVAHYTFNPEDAFHIEGTAGVGAAFAGKAAPLVSGALYLIHDFTEHFGVSGGLAFAGAWTSANANAATGAVASGDDPIGYVTMNHASSTLFTPSYAVRVGLKFKPW